MTSANFIEHVTEINVPIQVVWEALIDLENWDKWNKWFRLEPSPADVDNGTDTGTGTDTAIGTVVTGTKVKVYSCFDGDDKEWNSFDCIFREVDRENNILSWFSNIGPDGCFFSACHTMRLEPISGEGEEEGKTRLIHTEQFGGIMAMLLIWMIFKKLDRNYLLANESLKAFVEKE